MRRRIGRFFMWVGGIVVGLVVLLIVVSIFSGEEGVPERTVLTVDFEKQIVEHVPDNPIAKILAKDVQSIHDVVNALHRGADDDRVLGLVAQVGSSPLGFAQVQEIRDAVLAFRKSGKSTVIFSETFGEVGAGTGAYYLASAFESVYLQPSGDVGLTGLAMEHPFVKGMLDSLDVVVRMDHRQEYKNAMNLFTEDQFTEAHREATEGLLNSLYGQLVSDLAVALDSTPEGIQNLIDDGPFIAQRALDRGLVADLVYWDEVDARMKTLLGDKFEYLTLKKYLKRAGSGYEDGTDVAVVYGIGAVMRGKSEYDPASESSNMGSDTVAKAIRDAVKDKDVKAIVFRVDSPGGSYVASDAIWRETVKAKEAGKPVIVTMGNVAASGGYFVSMHADKIVAQPGTITGSIGVVAGKMVTPGFWRKLGVTWDEAHVGENALIWSSGSDYTPEQWAKFQGWLDRVYSDFTEKVAAGRSMPVDKVLAVAKGRVWTGEDARARGLVDELGGMQTALDLVRQSLELEPDAPLHLRTFPKEKELLELIMEEGFIQTFRQGDAVAALYAELRPVFQLAHTLGVSRRPGILEADFGEFRF